MILGLSPGSVKNSVWHTPNVGSSTWAVIRGQSTSKQIEQLTANSVMLLVCSQHCLDQISQICLRTGEYSRREYPEGRSSIPRPSGQGLEPGSCGDFAPRSHLCHSCQGQSNSTCSQWHVVLMSPSNDQLISTLHSSLYRAAMKFQGLPPFSAPGMGFDLPY